MLMKTFVLTYKKDYMDVLMLVCWLFLVCLFCFVRVLFFFDRITTESKYYSVILIGLQRIY